MQLCEKRPGKSALREYLSGVFSENDIDFDESFNYKQWVHTDRTALVDMQLPLEELRNVIAYDSTILLLSHNQHTYDQGRKHFKKTQLLSYWILLKTIVS